MIRIMAKGNSREQLLLENKAVAEKDMRGRRIMAFHLRSSPLLGYGFSNCVYAFIWYKLLTTLRGLWGLGLGSTRWSSVSVSPHICEPGWEKRADTSNSSSLQLPGEGRWLTSHPEKAYFCGSRFASSLRAWVPKTRQGPLQSFPFSEALERVRLFHSCHLPDAGGTCISLALMLWHHLFCHFHTRLKITSLPAPLPQSL